MNDLTVPDGLGDLSTYMLNKAIEHLDGVLRDADEETRKAVEIVKLVARVPRRSPWYGAPMDPEDSSVTVGVVLSNLLDMLPHERGYVARVRQRLEQGRRAYYDYLDHLFDPVRHAQEEATRLTEQQAQAQHAIRRERYGEWLRGEL